MVIAGVVKKGAVKADVQHRLKPPGPDGTAHDALPHDQ